MSEGGLFKERPGFEPDFKYLPKAFQVLAEFALKTEEKKMAATGTRLITALDVKHYDKCIPSS